MILDVKHKFFFLIELKIQYISYRIDQHNYTQFSAFLQIKKKKRRIELRTSIVFFFKMLISNNEKQLEQILP